MEEGLLAWEYALALYGTPYGAEIVMSQHRADDMSGTMREQHLVWLVTEGKTALSPVGSPLPLAGASCRRLRTS